MTDQRLRDLERDAAHGDLQAQARLLLERVRVGDLTEERLRLAAYLGDEAALAAVGHDVEPVARLDAGWFRGLEPWSPALAVWALAEACPAEHREPADAELLDRARVELRTAFMAGTAVEFARSQTRGLPAELCYTSPAGKSLCLWFHRLGQDGRRVRADDPDVVRAVADVCSRLRSVDPSELTYAWTEREHDGTWVHKLRHGFSRKTGTPRFATVAAVPGWEPGADATPAGPEFLFDLNFAVANPDGAKAAVRAALLPWALAPRRSST